MAQRAASRMSRSAGFTLIELMVVVIIATILLSIAIPAYTSQIRKSRRTEARTAVLDLASHTSQRPMEQFNRMVNCFQLGRQSRLRSVSRSSRQQLLPGERLLSRLQRGRARGALFFSYRDPGCRQRPGQGHAVCVVHRGLDWKAGGAGLLEHGFDGHLLVTRCNARRPGDGGRSRAERSLTPP